MCQHIFFLATGNFPKNVNPGWITWITRKMWPTGIFQKFNFSNRELTQKKRLHFATNWILRYRSKVWLLFITTWGPQENRILTSPKLPWNKKIHFFGGEPFYVLPESLKVGFWISEYHWWEFSRKFHSSHQEKRCFCLMIIEISLLH